MFTKGEAGFQLYFLNEIALNLRSTTTGEANGGSTCRDIHWLEHFKKLFKFGKSTLIKILTGVYKPDSGEIIINDEKINLNSPNDAILKGISVVHQERNLIGRFSVGENLMLNNLPKNFTLKSLPYLEIDGHMNRIGYEIISDAIIAKLN